MCWPPSVFTDRPARTMAWPIAIVQAIIATAAAAQEKTLRIATQNPRGHPIVLGLERFADPQDALEIVKNVKGIPYVNVGNFGRVNKDKMNRKTFSDSLYANEDEIKAFREIIATGIDCEYRMLTTDPKTSLAALIGK